MVFHALVREARGVGGDPRAQRAVVLDERCVTTLIGAYAVPVGGGKPALPSDTRADLELLDESRLGNGVVYLRYRIPT